MVDDFCIKYVNAAGLDDLRQTFQQAGYEVTYDAKGTKFVGLTINYNRTKRYLEISCPGYVSKVLKRSAHRNIKPCDSPMIYVPPIYGATTQEAHTDTTPELTPAKILEAQNIIGCVLWYSRLIDAPTLPAVSKAATALGDRKASLMAQLDRLLGHLMAYPDNVERFYASDMILYAFSDLSYLFESHSRNRAGGVAFYGWRNNPERINGPVLTSSTILDVVVGSVAEGEYGAAYKTARQIVWLRIVAAALGRPQPTSTTIHVVNTTAVGLANDTLKIERSEAIDMRFHWLCDRVRQGQLCVVHIPGERQLADFFTEALAVWQYIKHLTINNETAFEGVLNS